MARKSPANPRIHIRTRATTSPQVLDLVRNQRLVGGDLALARQLAKAGALARFGAEQELIRQGAQDSDLLLVLSGEVSIRVNNREIARRVAGQHVGEMSLVDSQARRSATVLACEETVALRISEASFSKIAEQHPVLWRRMAIEIASRLRDRNRSVRPPNLHPIAFIGSSSESLRVAKEVHHQLGRSRDIRPLLWTDGVFQPSSTAIESLVNAAQSSDFACLVLSADDVLVSKGKKVASPRDNVVFELGLLIGSLGRERAFFLKPKGIEVRIPSDLFGVVWLEYARTGPLPLRKRLRPACKTMLTRIESLGPR